ncbi:MAG: hypothetical protein Fur0012_10360 [Elusimicrobiota bacterium]
MAGKFYPLSADELRSFVKSAISLAKGCSRAKVKGILAPHAGYSYSGKAAGIAYACLENIPFSTAIVIGTGHVKHLEKAAVPVSDIFSTPLGDIEVDNELKKKFLDSSFFTEDEQAHRLEHSIEVQLPFLQEIGKEKFKILPVVLNSINPEILRKVGITIGEALKKDGVILIVSSDLSHYPPGELARLSDRALLEAYRLAFAGAGENYFSLAFKLLSDRFPEIDTPACGFSPMSASLTAMLSAGFNGFEKIYYTHSGEISQDNSAVVGYGCGVFYRGSPTCAIELSESEKKHLLSFARASLEKKLKGKSFFMFKPSYKFLIPSAVFVTLKKDGKLRGCIGCLEPHILLDEAVGNYALAAAFEDNRFPPLEADELGQIGIEISILSPLKRVSSHVDIIPGIHGVVIRKGRLCGTYLPQVWEHFDSKEEFLSSLCLEKAGLPADFWKEKSAEIYVYSAEHFEE